MHKQPSDFQRRALVTGASVGLGKAFAEQLAREGWRVTLVARREPELHGVAKSLSGNGHSVLAADLATQSGLSEVAAELASGNYSLLINNAGFGWIGHSLDMPDETMERMLSLNIAALAHLSSTFLKSAKPGDALVNVASILGLVPYPPQNLYAATKAFVQQFTVGLWEEFQPRGIHVMALCPGATETEFFKNAGKSDISAYRKMMKSETVVSIALSALKNSKKPICIPGWHNQLFVFLIRHLIGITPGVRLLGKFGRRL